MNPKILDALKQSGKLPTNTDQSTLLRRPGAELSNRYQLVRELGAGGMGEVWLAKDANPDGEQSNVALKFLPHHQLQDQAAKTRFKKEFGTVRKLQSKFICPVYDLQLDDARFGPYLVMKFVEGESLATLVSRRGQLDVTEALGILTQIAEGLDDLHEAGIQHRDVKPENIMLERLSNNLPRVQIVDFGIAGKIIPTSQGDVAPSPSTTQSAEGTERYMSPEQWNSGRPSARSDQYSFACVAYEILAGFPVFDGTPDELRSQHLSAEPKAVAGLPASGLAVLRKGMAKQQKERYATCREFVLELKNAMIGAGNPKSPIQGKGEPPKTKPAGFRPPKIKGLRTTARAGNESPTMASGAMPVPPANPPAAQPANSSPVLESIPNPVAVSDAPPPFQMDVLAKTSSLKMWLGLEIGAAVVGWLGCFGFLIFSLLSPTVQSNETVILGLLIIVAFGAIMIGVATFVVSNLIFLATAWAAIPTLKQTPVSTAITRLFIPFYGIYWHFRLQYVILDELERYTRTSAVSDAKIPRDLFWWMFATIPFGPVYYIMQVLVHLQMIKTFRQLRHAYQLPV